MIQDDIDQQNGIHRSLIHCVRTPSTFVPPRLSPSARPICLLFLRQDRLIHRSSRDSHFPTQSSLPAIPQSRPPTATNTRRLSSPPARQFDGFLRRPSLLLFLLAHSMTVKHHAFKSSHQQPLVPDRWIRMASHETIPTSASDFPILTTPRSSPPRPLVTSYSTARTSW